MFYWGRCLMSAPEGAGGPLLRPVGTEGLVGMQWEVAVLGRQREASAVQGVW